MLPSPTEGIGSMHSTPWQEDQVSWREDPGDRLARLKAAFVQAPSEERKERMVAALHRYWRARNGSAGVGLPEEVAAMDLWADGLIEQQFRERR